MIEEKNENNAFNLLNKKFGKNTIFMASSLKDDNQNRQLHRMETGSFTLDLALGGGLPLGRFIHICGNLSSTKTTQVLHMIRIAQGKGLRVALVDAENTTTLPYMEQLGIDPSKLMYTNPSSMEEALDLIIYLQSNKLVDFVVLDSIAALAPSKELSSDMDETTQMGVAPKLLNEFLKKYQAANNKLMREGDNPVTLIGINQLREKIGVMYGSSEFSPGGRAIGFMCSANILFRTGDVIREGNKATGAVIGNQIKFKIEKNKTFHKGIVGAFDFYYEDNSLGIPRGYNDYIKEVVVAGIKYGVIKVAGSWMEYRGKKYHGVDELTETLRSDNNLIDGIKKAVLSVVTRKEGM